MQQYPVIYNSSSNLLEEIANGDTLNPIVFPVSARSNNNIKLLSDGFYQGSSLAGPVIYVEGSGGADVSSGGFSTGTALATLDYALSTILGGSLTGQNVTIALQAGRAFTMPNDFSLHNGSKLQITSYGDTSGNGSVLGTQSFIAGTSTLVDVNSTLSRPTIANASTYTNGYYGSSKFLLNDDSKLILSGLSIILPANPGGIVPSSYGTQSDLVYVGNGQSGSLSLIGCVINMQDTTSMCGLAGVQARTELLKVTQYATQLLVGGAQVNSGSTVAALGARVNFFKFYADFAGNNQVSTSVQPTSLTSSAGTGLMSFSWSDVQAQVITGSDYNLATYPYLGDASYGLKYYFTGLVRDQQSRPLNLISGRLL